MKKDKSVSRKIGLLYVGKDEFIPGIPARDLFEDEIEKRGGKQALLATGLYREPGPKPEVK